MNRYTELVNRLCEPTSGHGAFGEREIYAPPAIQIEAAMAIKELQLLCKQYALQRLTAEEQAILGVDK